MTATHEFVVPTSMPMILLIFKCLRCCPFELRNTGSRAADPRYGRDIWVRGRGFNPGHAYFATITIAGRTRRSLSR